MPDSSQTTPPPILLCLDLESGCETLAHYAALYAARSGQPVHVLHIMPRASPRSQHENVQQRLDHLVAATLPSAAVTAVTIHRGRPEDGILAYATEHDVDPIVLGRRRRSTRERIHIGSTTSAVIAQATRPVLVVPVLAAERR